MVGYNTVVVGGPGLYNMYNVLVTEKHIVCV